MCKPDPRHLLGTISSAGGRPLSTIMIGDSSTDVKTARAAGVPIVGVTFGYSDVPIEKLNCNAIISHYDQLPIALESVVNSK
ncbi:MAG: HAD hydrolase-like protein [Hyphomicrobiaceae bacterium]|nr:HAD hydrolase-like protein [Hyphomicrobiaceae bacterium]